MDYNVEKPSAEDNMKLMKELIIGFYEDYQKDGYINDIREHFRCDVVVKNRINNDDTLLFLREIPEVEIVRDMI